MVKNVGAITTWTCYIQIYIITRCVIKGLHCNRLKLFCQAADHATQYFVPGFAQFEKYLNLEGFLEKYLKIDYAFKSTGKSLKSLEVFEFYYFLWDLSVIDRDLHQYKIIVPIFGAAYAAPNKGTTI